MQFCHSISIPGRARRAAIAGGAPPGFSLGGFSLKCCDKISKALGNCCGVPVSLQPIPKSAHAQHYMPSFDAMLGAESCLRC